MFTFCKRENVSFEFFNPNSRYWVHISRPRGKNGFFAVRCRFWALFENSICGFFLEMSEGTEISTVKISGKKLMTLVHLPYKYLSHTTITLEYIEKINRMFFFRPHSSANRVRGRYGSNRNSSFTSYNYDQYM